MAANLIVLLPLFLAFCAQYIAPSASSICTLCGLAFPYLLYANMIFVVLWLFIKYPFSLFSLSLILLNINNIDKYFQFKATEVPEPCINCVKVLSYNVKLFGVYDSDEEAATGKKKQQIFKFLKEERPDFACFQEYFYEKNSKLNFPTTDSILTILNLDDDGKHCFQYFPMSYRNQYFYGLAIFTRYRIINSGHVNFSDSSANAAIFVDIKFKRDTIRIYNVHLASIHMSQDDYEASRKLATQVDDPEFNKNAKMLSDKLLLAFEQREVQVDSLRAHMDSCHHSIILCGDFNDTPSSYAYNKIARKLHDSFRRSGHGFGITYNGDAVPAFRIDYILHAPDFRSYGHTVAKQINVSDHFPIVTNISLQKSDL